MQMLFDRSDDDKKTTFIKVVFLAQCNCITNYMKKIHDSEIIGKKFGRLTVKKFIKYHFFECGKKQKVFLCKCECGTEREILFGSIKSGNTKSCGCLQKEETSNARKKHGMSKTRIYRTWEAMKRRCLKKSDSSYKYYGGRGIEICDRWKNSFENFYEDMKNGYSDELQIERKNNNGNYSPENCIWATRAEQSKNTRRNVFIICKGKTQTMSEWSAESGICIGTIFARLKLGWSGEKAVTQPVKFLSSRK